MTTFGLRHRVGDSSVHQPCGNNIMISLSTKLNCKRTDIAVLFLSQCSGCTTSRAPAWRLARPPFGLPRTHTTGCQTEDSENVYLERTIKEQTAVIKRQENEISMSKEQLQKMSFNPDGLLPTDDAVQFYTCFPNRVAYEHVFHYFSSKAEKMHYWDGGDRLQQAKNKNRETKKAFKWSRVSCGAGSSKRGLFHTYDSAARLQISTSLFTQIFTSWVRLWHEVRHFLPPACAKYEDLCAWLHRVFLFFLETPSSLTAQRETWSSYKTRNTFNSRYCIKKQLFCCCWKLVTFAANISKTRVRRLKYKKE